MDKREHYVHGELLKTKSRSNVDLANAYQLYLKFIDQISKEYIRDEVGVNKLVFEFNEYRKQVIGILESRKNSGQENLRSSMLEEFFCHLFSDLLKESLSNIPNNLFMGKAKSYVDLAFSPSSFKNIFVNPNPYIHTKDQDFVLGVSLDLEILSNKHSFKEKLIIPVLAIECKTYIEKNMLDSCAGTARRLKSAMPYCMYIVVAEYMKMKDVQPELSDINEIYIFCKATNSDRLKNRKNKLTPHPVNAVLVFDLFMKVKGHLNSIWWSPDSALRTGKIINRP
ncbi:MAG: Bpu10I family restriction endonuclease [Bacteroidota bacterium]